MSRAEHEDRRRATAVRWCPGRAPRPAYYEAPEEYPGLPSRLWCRLYRLMAHRGLLTSDPARRLAAYLADTDTVHANGTIPDAPAMLAGYAARAGVSMQTAWTDLGRLTVRGLVRQVQAAAPGIKARYRLSAPAAMIRAHLPGLPPELTRALYRDEPEPADDENQGDDSGSGSFCGGLDTSPHTREGSPPPPDGRARHRASRRSGRPCRGSHDPGNNDAAALLARCRNEWVRQRGEQRVPAPDRLAGLVPLTSRALRVTARPGDVAQLLTERVASADDLVRTLRWRLSREVADARRAETPRLSPAEERAAERRAAEYYQARRAAEQAAVEARRGPDHAERALAVVDLARQLRAGRENMFAADHRYAEEIAARGEQERTRELELWRRETRAETAGQDQQALDEIRRLMAGTAEDRSRARALAQLTTSRARRLVTGSPESPEDGGSRGRGPGVK